MKFQTAAALLLAAVNSSAAHLNPAAEQAFAAYITKLEQRLDRQHASPDTYLATLNGEPSARAAVEGRLFSGGTWIEPVNGGTWQAAGALMHHWRAAAFVPGAAPDEMLTLLRNPNRLSRYYAPQIVSSQMLPSSGKLISLIRFKKKKVVTVVLDAQFEGRNELTGADRGYSISRSQHIWQVEDPGTPREHRRPEGDDDGFLWRLNSYWSFAETQNGLLIECEAVSLTRNIPLGLGWLISPIIETLPRESLEFTLKATKNALVANAQKEALDVTN